MTDSNIRWLLRRDMDAVLDIDARSFTDVWDHEHFMVALRERNCIGVVAEAYNVVMGYVLYELHKTRMEVLRLAVHPDYRNQGVGSALIDRLVRRLSASRRTRLYISVDEYSLNAQLWLKRLGFRCVTIERYEDGEGYRFCYRIRKEATA